MYSTVFNADSVPLRVGHIVRIVANKRVVRAQADTLDHLNGLYGVVAAGVSNPIGPLIVVTTSPSQIVLLEDGLTVAAGDTLYVSGTDPGKATNVSPGNAAPIGLIEDIATYNRDRCVLAGFALNGPAGGGAIDINTLIAELIAHGFTRPPISNDKAVITLDTAVQLTGNILAGDYDPDGGPIFLNSVTYGGTTVPIGGSFNTQYGLMLIGGDGSWTYTLGASARALRTGQTGFEVFTYEIGDGRGGISRSTLTITITGTDQPPIVESVNNYAPLNATITGNILYYYAFAWEPVTLAVTQWIVAGIPGTNAPGDVVAIPSVGSLEIDANGDYTFIPTRGFTGSLPLVTYTVGYGGPTTNGYLTLAIIPIVDSTTPIILYTDLVSGPATGGQGDLGAYLSIFGLSFGDGSGLGTTTKVFIGGVEVAAYVLQEAAVNIAQFPGVQKIVVRPGALTLGVPLPIVVRVGSTDSNANNRWTSNPGRVIYASLSGDDTTGTPNDITKPYRHLQLPDRHAGGVYPILRAGDQVVIRGGAWSDIGYDTTWLRFRDPEQEGSAPIGTTGTGWIAFTAYPGEVVHYTTPAGKKGGFQGAGQAFSGSTGDFVAVSNIHFQNSPGVARDAGPINIQYSAGHWRVANNQIGPWPAGDSTVLNAAAVTGAGNRVFVLGNWIHDIEGTSELQNHGTYADATAYGWEVAYNIYENCVGGSGVQFNDSGDDNGVSLTGRAPTPEGIWPGFVNIQIHDNWINVCAKYGINVADVGSTGLGTTDVRAWNNVIQQTGLPPLRLNTHTPSGIVVYAFNTLYNCNTTNSAGTAYVRNDGDQLGPQHMVDVYNNILVFGPDTYSGTQWFSNLSGLSTGYDFKRNVYYASGQSPTSPGSIDSMAIIANPQFTNAAGQDFTLQGSSPAINAALQPLPAGMRVPSDFTSQKTRLLGGVPDCGAYEYDDPRPYTINAPTTSGGPQVGVVTTVDTGTWGNSPTRVTRQWKLDGVDVGGATGATYTPVAADVRKSLSVVVTATNVSGSTIVTLVVGTIAVGAGGPVNTVAPVASGAASVGSVLSTTNGTWSGTVSGYAYQWQRGASPSGSFSDIGSATSSTYTAQSGDAGLYVRCTVFALNLSTGSGRAYSNAIGAVAAAPADPLVVQSTGKYIGAGSDTVTLSGVTVGNWVVTFVFVGGTGAGSADVVALTDNRGNNLKSLGSLFTGDPSKMRWAQIRDTIGGAYTVTATTGGDSIQVFLVEVSTCDLASFLDGFEVFQTGDRFENPQDTTPSGVGYGPTTVAKDLILILAGEGYTLGPSGALSPDGAWTVEQSGLSGADRPAAVWSRKLASTGVFHCSATIEPGDYPPPFFLGIIVKGS